jgi:hypothetical protein
MSVSFYTANRVNFGSHPGIAAPQCGNYDDDLVVAKTKAALGCGGPRGALPLIHHNAASGTAILTMAVGVKNSPPFHTADQPTQERKNL